MAEMEEKIRNMEASTYDGVFIWKITEFARKRQEAITGRSPAIFSPGYCPKIEKAFLCLIWLWGLSWWPWCGMRGRLLRFWSSLFPREM